MVLLLTKNWSGTLKPFLAFSRGPNAGWSRGLLLLQGGGGAAARKDSQNLSNKTWEHKKHAAWTGEALGFKWLGKDFGFDGPGEGFPKALQGTLG